ncbi:larval cuticle protein 65Ag1-like isoform X1 [Pollicipes pollicipes]|uniref:larval cuticle protein 65Ag1-like isoform X1 n=1 Tax=Pollicipes pollicipes TaxID=41117 RepID=UPI00188512DE|nr:larval cuticle protein 65Ag1-like isoform X1 [Pollicipes pollicipes]
MKLMIVFAVVASALAAPQNQPQVNIVSQSFDQDEQGNYNYQYQLDNGQSAEEAGTVLAGPEPETGSIDVQGSYTFVADDGNTYSVSYAANEGGFQPDAPHLPVAPAQIAEYEQLRADHPELFWAETQ